MNAPLTETLRKALADHYPGHAFTIPPFLTFGSWMGGDRDGNPFVTADITARTLCRLRDAAIDMHLEECRRLYDFLTISLRHSQASKRLLDRLESLGMVGESVSTKIGAQTTLAVLDDALMRVNSVRADLGAVQNRMQSTINSLAISDENLSAANSRIRDADLAQEVSEMTKNNILMQAGVSVLGQANQASQSALKLLS